MAGVGLARNSGFPDSYVAVGSLQTFRLILIDLRLPSSFAPGMWIVYPRTFPITVVTGCAEVQQRLLISQSPRKCDFARCLALGHRIWHLAC